HRQERGRSARLPHRRRSGRGCRAVHRLGGRRGRDPQGGAAALTPHSVGPRRSTLHAGTVTSPPTFDVASTSDESRRRTQSPPGTGTWWASPVGLHKSTSRPISTTVTG